MLKKALIIAAIVVASLFVTTVDLSIYHGYKAGHTSVTHNTSLQAKASHRVEFLNDKEEQTGLCTATAIGPHALLTAQHCDESQDDSRLLIDQSLRRYHIIAASYDGRDHVIYLLSGPAFTNIAPYKARSPQLGEEVTIVGFGGGTYPAIDKYGKINTRYDLSDVDAGQKEFHFSSCIIPGDSGSAVFGKDGAILGLVTWGGEDACRGAGFELNYPANTIFAAQHYEGE